VFVGDSSLNSQTGDCAIIRKSEIRRLIPFSDSTIARMERAGTFPRRFAIGTSNGRRTVVGWSRAAVLAWIESKQAAAGADS